MKDTNLNTYNSGKVINWYKNLNELVAAERIVFENNKAVLLQGNVLDIGIGGGRTTAYLVNKCKHYTGIDYSQGFVSAAQIKYPKKDIRLMDARDLSVFVNNSFDFVNFSFNGIDYVSPADRQKIFSEINRVLKPGGIFFFSTHNKDHFSFGRAPWLNKTNSALINLKTFLKLFFYLPKHLQQKRKEIHLKDYSVINDSAHNYSLMTFYTTPQFLRTQLSDKKFTEIILLSKDGQARADIDLDEWIFVSCKRSLA